MSLRKQLEETMHNAMRAKDDQTRDTIRMVFSSIKQLEVESRSVLDDSEILSILQKEVKIRNETISELSNSNRSDLIEKAKAEIEILSKFLPAQLTDEELSEIAKKTIVEVSASNPSDMGKVMKALLPAVKGRAQPDRESRIVKDILNG